MLTRLPGICNIPALNTTISKCRTTNHVLTYGSTSDNQIRSRIIIIYKATALSFKEDYNVSPSGNHELLKCIFFLFSGLVGFILGFIWFTSDVIHISWRQPILLGSSVQDSKLHTPTADHCHALPLDDCLLCISSRLFPGVQSLHQSVATFPHTFLHLC
jgi:hypothetical protein